MVSAIVSVDCLGSLLPVLPAKAIFQEQLVQLYDAWSAVIFHAIVRCGMTWSIDTMCKFFCQFPKSFQSFAMSPGKRVTVQVELSQNQSPTNRELTQVERNFVTVLGNWIAVLPFEWSSSQPPSTSDSPTELVKTGFIEGCCLPQPRDGVTALPAARVPGPCSRKESGKATGWARSAGFSASVCRSCC